jgi:spore photoproduct lyase
VFNTLYIEKQVADHPRVAEICARYPKASRVECDRYGEVFNPNAQDFRLQKAQPALILARKHSGHVLQAPQGYGIGGERNHYFSHMLNCLYDCRYCFLQGMYRSAHHVLYVNYEDFADEIDRTLVAAGNRTSWFFSGYDCDSLAMEPVSGFVEHFLPFFATRPQARLELRTKSTQIRSLLKTKVLPNVVVAFSFTPGEVYQALEHRVPAIERRLDAMLQLQQAGWPLGLRFDPMIYQDNYQADYRLLFEQLFSRLDTDALHSVSLGTFRLPRGYFKKMVQLYPDERLFAGNFESRNDMISYPSDLEQEMTAFCTQELLQHIPEPLLFPCSLAA